MHLLKPIIAIVILFSVCIAQNNTDKITIEDADGNVYQTVKIGDQVWTVENLMTTKYNDGTPIPNVADNREWANLKNGAYCYYDNYATKKEECGLLYNWHAVNTGKLAPEGWHVPTDEDWTDLVNCLKKMVISDGETLLTGHEVLGQFILTDMIGKLMASKTDWPSSSEKGDIGNNMSSNNKSGFSALPCGLRNYSGKFGFGSYGADWWSATELDEASQPRFREVKRYSENGSYRLILYPVTVKRGHAWYRALHYEYGNLDRSTRTKVAGSSIRCIKD